MSGVDDGWHWHFSPLCISGYAFSSKNKTYENRDTPDLVLTITCTHEGSQAYISGFHRNGKAFSVHALRGLQTFLRENGILRARWEHNHKKMVMDTATGKISRDDVRCLNSHR